MIDNNKCKMKINYIKNEYKNIFVFILYNLYYIMTEIANKNIFFNDYEKYMIFEKNEEKLIENSYIEIHNEPFESHDELLQSILSDDSLFGRLTVKMMNLKSKNTLRLFFTIDNICNFPINSNYYHIFINFFINMLFYLLEKNENVYLSIHTITNINIINDFKLKTSNIKELINKIEKLYKPNDDKNDYTILSLLKETNETIEYYKILYPNDNMIHVVFNIDEMYLFNQENVNYETNYLLDNSNYTLFLGIGDKHDNSLGFEIGKNKNTKYHILTYHDLNKLRVDDKYPSFEYDNVYDNLFKEYLNPLIEKVTISISDGFLYDWKTNEWVNEIKEDVFSSNMEKNYFIKTKDEDNISATIYGTKIHHIYNKSYNKSDINENELLDIVIPLPRLITIGNVHPDYTNLTKYIFQLKLQSLVYRILVLINTKNRFIFDFIQYKKEISNLNNEIEIVFDWIFHCLRNSSIEYDNVIKILYNDLLLIYNKIESKRIFMHLYSIYMKYGNGYFREEIVDIYDNIIDKYIVDEYIHD
jgi:hypothetical protein